MEVKTFCYFVEPASYTKDLINHVYKGKFDYAFINSRSYSGEGNNTSVFLDNLNFLQKVVFINNVIKKYDLIIINGYNNLPFILSFILIWFREIDILNFRDYSNKKFLAIDSDTQYRNISNPILRFIKYVYLFFIFSKEYVLGLAGGNNFHKELFRKYGMDEERIFLLPMMVNNSKFNIQKQFPDIFTFLYVGRIVPHKNIEQIINEFNAKFSNLPCFLKIVGSGGFHERYLRKKYSDDNIIFEGKLFGDDLINTYNSSSCLLIASQFEPWGLVVNESLSSGLPVISLETVGSSYDLIYKKDTGFVSKDMNEFGKNMLKIYNDKNLLMNFSENAINLMKNYWNYSLYEKSIKKVVFYVENNKIIHRLNSNKETITSKNIFRVKLIKNFIIKCFSLLCYENKSKVIFYHDIHNSNIYTHMSTSICLFKEHIDVIRENGFTIVNKITNKRNQIRITFDDGWRGIYENIDLLEELEVPVTIFISTDMIGKRNFLTKNQIIKLSNHPLINIQSHSKCHVPLTSLNDNDLTRNLVDSKKILERYCSAPITELCYPFGRFSRSIINRASDCGYHNQFSSIPSSVNSTLVIGRSLVQFASKSKLKCIIKGGDNILYFWYKIKHYNFI